RSQLRREMLATVDTLGSHISRNVESELIVRVVRRGYFDARTEEILTLPPSARPEARQAALDQASQYPVLVRDRLSVVRLRYLIARDLPPTEREPALVELEAECRQLGEYGRELGLLAQILSSRAELAEASNRETLL